MSHVAEAFEREALPHVRAAVAQTVGRPVEIEVKWATLLFDCETDRYHDVWSKLYFVPLERAVLDVCRDEVGRTALAKILTRVVVQSTQNITSSRDWCHFENGTVTLDHAMAEVDDVDERAQRLVGVLERAASE